MSDTSPDEIAREESVRQAISTFRARIDDLVGEFNEKLKSKIAVASEGQALTLRFGSKNIELWFEALTQPIALPPYSVLSSHSPLAVSFLLLGPERYKRGIYFFLVGDSDDARWITCRVSEQPLHVVGPNSKLPFTNVKALLDAAVTFPLGDRGTIHDYIDSDFEEMLVELVGGAGAQ
jgi:hypothetical protein